MKIRILDGYALNPGDLSWEGIKSLGETKIYERIPYEESKIIEAIDDAEIIFTNKTPITREILEKVPTVKYIGVLATGYNVVDVDAAKELGIIVTNIPSYSTDSVAQMTFAFILEMCNHVGKHNEAVQKGEWSNSIDFCFWKSPLIELKGKTIGIIGFGQIGQATAKIAQAFGMKVITYSRTKRSELENESCKYVNFEDLLATSDIISLHCPMLKETEGIINKESIAKMKDGVMLVNTSRGQLIVEEDLKEALNSGKIAAAAADVVSYEPIKENNPLLKAKNCIITPHIAWAPREARQRLMDIATNNLKAFINGEPINVVNM